MSSKNLPSPLPAIWDRIADNEPDRVVASIAIGSEVKDGYRDITARCLADAINRAAWFLESELGKSDAFETLCYLGPSDLRYPILMAAASKVGYKTFWTSPRNSFEGHIKLMEATECTIFLTPSATPPGVAQVVQRLHMRHIIIPEQSMWLDSMEPVKHYPFDKTYTQCSHDPLTVIHTSGSTGV
jgi:acyl-coenzyme A synthetase/AMP-(fatty) acid ligase